MKKTPFLITISLSLFLLLSSNASAMTVAECQSAPPAGKGGTCVNGIFTDCVAPSRGNPGQTSVGPCTGGRGGGQDLGSCCVNNVSGGGPAPIPAPKPGGTPNSDASCKNAGGTCNTTCASGSTQNGTCTSGQCCVPNGSTGTPGGATGPTATNNIQISFENPTDYDTVETFLDSVLGFMRNIVVILALVFLVIGALLYITSGGNDKRIGVAKAAITAALIGLAIVMVAPSFLKELAGVLGWDDLPSQASDALTLTEIATNVLNFLLAIIGVLAIIMFLVGAIMYLTSAGDEKRAGTGKSIVQSAIIGIIVAFSALVLVKQIAAFF